MRATASPPACGLEQSRKVSSGRLAVRLGVSWLPKEEHEDGLMDDGYAKQTLRHQLELILTDDLVYQLVTDRGFSPGFVALYESIRKELLRIRNQRGM